MIPENAFAPAGPRESFVETAAGSAALGRLDDGLGVREPFLLLTGEAGMGKTTLVREAIARWGARVAPACLAYTALSGAELLEEAARRLGGDPPAGASRSALVACCERALAGSASQGRVAMLIVDDAHRLPAELLEELRLLVNAAQQGGWPFEVLLVGLPSIESTLEAATLAPLRQRFSVRARLAPMADGEIRRYLRHRVAVAGGDGPALFPRATCNEIAVHAGGVPRRLNAIASEAMRLARSAGAASVQAAHVRTAAGTLWGPLKSDGEAPAESRPAGPSPAMVTPEVPAPAAPPAARAASPAAKVAPEVPAPAAPPAARTVSPAAKAAPAPPASADRHAATSAAPPARQDANEWVARFVGDKGPIRIGSQAAGSFAASRTSADFPDELPGAPAPALPSSSARARRRRGGALRLASYAALAGFAVVALVIWIVRAQGTPRGPKPAAAVERAASTPAVQAPGSGVRTKSAAPGVTTLEPDRAPATRTDAAPERPRSPTGRWTLEVSADESLDRAFEERDRAEQLAGIEGWVVPAPEGSGAPHRIVLGIFRSYDRANAAARMLLTSKTLPAVRVVPLPRRGDRR